MKWRRFRWLGAIGIKKWGGKIKDTDLFTLEDDEDYESEEDKPPTKEELEMMFTEHRAYLNSLPKQAE